MYVSKLQLLGMRFRGLGERDGNRRFGRGLDDRGDKRRRGRGLGERVERRRFLYDRGERLKLGGVRRIFLLDKGEKSLRALKKKNSKFVMPRTYVNRIFPLVRI